MKYIKKEKEGNSLLDQWLGLSTFTAGAQLLGLGMKIPKAARHAKKKKREREKEKAIIFQGCWIYATAKSSPGWELIFSCGPIIPDFLLFCYFFLNKTLWLKEKSD